MTLIEVVIMIVCVFLNVFIETSVVTNLNFFGILPDTIIAATVAISLVNGSYKGAVYGALCGLIIDILFGSVIGLHFVAYLLIGLIASRFAHKYFSTNLLFASILAFFAYFFKEFLIILSLSLQNMQFSLGGVFLRFMLPAGALTGIIVIPLYFFYRRYKQHEIRRMKYR